jgi:YD repeat-containing protein
MTLKTRLPAYWAYCWTTVIALSLLAIPVRAQSAVQYVYDELGRLAGVIDTSGNAAGYAYDAVGNLSSISRFTASQISVLDFSPRSGPVGTVVTIGGTAYSTTLSQDSVSFNGSAAAIASATINQIVVTVPTGATTGTIKVTTPSGTFTTSSSFTITAGTGAPTITSFTPTIATAGTSIAISGTNFDTTAANDRLKFNITRQFTSSATAVKVSTTVPTATSGHISVSNPAGSATSSQDLYIPFGSHVAGDVVSTGRTTLGHAATVSIGTASKIGLLIFDATAGQRVSFSLSGQSLSSCIFHVIDPDGTQPTLPVVNCASPYTFLDAVPASLTGTYTIGIDPGSSTGGITVTPNNATDLTGTISIGGSPVTQTTTTPGQNAQLTFSGNSGQVISMVASSVTFPDYAAITIYNPDGSTLASTTATSSGGAYIGATPLAQTGTYRIYIDPVNADTGQIITTLYNAAPATGTITAGGAAVTATTTVPGQNSLLTFSGTSGALVSLLIQNVSYDTTTVSIIEPSGTTLASTSVYMPSSYTFFIDTQTLPATGTYTIRVAPSDQVTGSATLTLYSVTNLSGAVTIGGSSTTLTMNTPGQNGSVTFSGTGGQSITVHLTSGTVAPVTVSLLDPSGTVLTSTFTYSSAFNLASQTLSATGTYTIIVDPYSYNTGSLTVNVTSP